MSAKAFYPKKDCSVIDINATVEEHKGEISLLQLTWLGNTDLLGNTDYTLNDAIEQAAAFVLACYQVRAISHMGILPQWRIRDMQI